MTWPMTVNEAICCLVKVGVLKDRESDMAKHILDELHKEAFRLGWLAACENYQWGPNPSKRDTP